MRASIAAAAGLLMLFGLPGCEASRGPSAQDEAAVRAAYASYRAAAAARDVEALKRVVTQKNAAELGAPGAAAGIAVLGSIDPATMIVRGVTFEGGRALIALTTPVEGGTGVGRVELVKEAGAWKVAKESWQIKIGAAPPPVPAPSGPPVERPFEFERLLGTWKGQDGGAGAEWTVVFGGAWDVSARNATGDEWYRGKAVARMDLGADARGRVWVLPGGAVLDVEVTESSRTGAAGKLSLGSYKLEGDRLTVCGSEPGKHVRTKDPASAGAGIRCFQLGKVSGTPEGIDRTAPR